MSISLRRRLVVATVLGLVASFGLGLMLGLRSPYGEKRLKTASGTARLQDAGVGLVSFTGDGVTTAFRMDAVSWRTANRQGDGNPPCLREGEDVPVEVGYLDLAMPDGTGVKDRVVWVDCPV